MNESTKLLSIGKTADMLGVHIDTLREWDKEGKLTPIKTFGNHRRYKLCGRGNRSNSLNISMKTFYQ